MHATLPVHVASKELKENPKFASLLADLSTQLVDGSSCDVVTELQKVKLSLDAAKLEYFKMALIHTQLNDMVLDHRCNPTSSSKKEAQLYDLLERRIAVSETAPLVPALLVNEPLLRETMVGDETTFKQQTPILSDFLKQKLEKYLSEKCISLAEFYDLQAQNEGLQLAKGLRLGDVLAAKTIQLATEKQSFSGDITNNMMANWEYYDVLLKVLGTLGTLITTHKLQQIQEEDEIQTTWLQERLKTMELKLHVLEQQFKEETYQNGGAQKALQTIAEHLHAAQSSAKLDYEKAVARRQQYDAVGLGFIELANEYASLLKEIKHNEWALDELEKSSNSEVRKK